MTLESVAALVENYRFRFSSETELQDGLKSVFEANQINFSKEYILTKQDRLDFLIDGIAVEVKIKGSFAACVRQIARYAAHDDIRSILVIGTPKWLHTLPTVIEGKPVIALKLLNSML